MSKIQIRQNTFETNSSSTHSIVICTKKQFDAWKSGLVRFDPYSEKFTDSFTDEQLKHIRETAEFVYAERHISNYYKTWDQLDESAKEEYVQQLIEEYKPSGNGKTFKEYRNYYQESCEYTEKHFKTEHGDEIVAFGKGGYDG